MVDDDMRAAIKARATYAANVPLQTVLREFVPRSGVPLAASLAFHMADWTYQTRITDDFWDHYMFDGLDSRIAAIKTVDRAHYPSLRRHMVTADVPTKLILVEHPDGYEDFWDQSAFFMRSQGVNAFLRGYGWVYAPKPPVPVDNMAIRLEKSPRWTQHGDVWLKACNTCGEFKEVDDFYPNPNEGATDPRRHKCKECTRAL
jgi:hypothetical protein